ncbi:FecR domain-containing protein [Planctomycetales bacterium ZRK34]|nr:FecR domain-containing protein [Planctomycetales bacterium ZRK34]
MHDTHDLILAFLEGDATAEQFDQLQQQLIDSPQARQLYRQTVDHCVDLRNLLRSAAVESHPSESLTPATSPWPWPWRNIGYAAAALIMLTATLTGWLMLMSTPSATPGKSQSPDSAPVAIVANLSSDAKFASSQLPLAPGSNLSASSIRLVAGTMQLMFNSTAMVDLAGPCTVDVTGPNRARLTAGVLEAHVPDRAHGFTVDLPGGMRVVDLGTRFKVVAELAGEVSVHVLEGKVLVIEADGTKRHLGLAQSARWVNGHFAGASRNAILASWDRWSDTNRPYDADTVLAGFGARIDQGSENRVLTGFGSNDGTFGIEGVATAADRRGLLVRHTHRSLTLSFTLINQTGRDYLIESFHFDFAPRRNNASNTGPNAFTLTYLTGGLGPHNTPIASTANLPYHITNNAGSVSDYPDYDLDLSAALSDRVLADGESAQFQLEFSGQTFDDSSSIVDNIAFIGSPVQADDAPVVPAPDVTSSSKDTPKETKP